MFKLSTNQRFDTIVRFLRKKLGVREAESVFCYVGSVFSPGLDEGVGDLWRVSSPSFAFEFEVWERGRGRGKGGFEECLWKGWKLMRGVTVF